MESSAPPQPPKGYLPVADWNLGQLVLVLVAGLAGAFIASVVFTAAEVDIFEPVPFSVVFLSQTGASFFVLIWLSRTKGTGSLEADFGFVIRPSSWWGVPAGMGLQVVIALMTAPFVFWLFGDDPPQQGVSDVAGSSETLLEQILVILAIAVAAPIIEEIIYRGMLLSWLRRRMSKWWSIVVSAAIFAVIHAVFDPSAIAVVPGLFLLGVVLAYAALRTGDLSLPIALHSGINLLAALSLLYGDRLLDWAETRLEELEAIIPLIPL